jgi:hypothetical protein
MTRLARFAPLTGMIFVALVVAGGLAVGSSPSGDDPITKVTAYYAAHHNRIFAAAILWAYAAVFFAFFGATLWSRVRGLARPVLAAGTLVGTAIASSSLLVWSAVNFALGDLGDKANVSQGAIESLHVLTDGLFIPVAAGISVLLLSVSLAAVLGGILPRWLGWIGIVIAIVQITPIGFFATLAFLLWTITVSILLLVRPAPTAPATAAR